MLPSPYTLPLTTTLLKTYLSQLVLSSISCLAIKKKLQGILRGKKTPQSPQFEETEQVSELDSDTARIVLLEVEFF